MANSETVDSHKLLETYRKESARQRLLIKQAKVCETRLLFIISALKELLPAGSVSPRLVALAAGVALVGAATVLVLGILQSPMAPTIARVHLSGVLLGTIPPLLALVGAAALAWLVFAWAASRQAIPRGVTTLLVVAMVMGYSLPAVGTLLISPIRGPNPSDLVIPAEGISAARWLRDHSDPSDLVATNMHCRTAFPFAISHGIASRTSSNRSTCRTC